MLYKFAEQLRNKLIESKSNEIIDALAELNNILAEKADVHKLEEQYQIKNAGLIKQINSISESIVMDLDLGDYSQLDKRIKGIYLALKDLVNISIGGLTLKLKEILDLIKQLKDL